jgi:hypothetical protein
VGAWRRQRHNKTLVCARPKNCLVTALTTPATGQKHSEETKTTAVAQTVQADSCHRTVLSTV